VCGEAVSQSLQYSVFDDPNTVDSPFEGLCEVLFRDVVPSMTARAGIFAKGPCREHPLPAKLAILIGIAPFVSLRVSNQGPSTGGEAHTIGEPEKARNDDLFKRLPRMVVHRSQTDRETGSSR